MIWERYLRQPTRRGCWQPTSEARAVGTGTYTARYSSSPKLQAGPGGCATDLTSAPELSGSSSPFTSRPRPLEAAHPPKASQYPVPGYGYGYRVPVPSKIKEECH